MNPPGRHLGGWGTVRLRLTLWSVAVLALILGALGGVVRYTVQADLFATVDRTLAERIHDSVFRSKAPVIPIASPSDSRPEPAASELVTAQAQGDDDDLRSQTLHTT